MITPLLALALVVPAPQDSEIEPVDQALVELFMAHPDGQQLCSDIGDISDNVDALGVIAGEDLSFIFDMAVSYWQQSAEEGVGEGAAMTLEAEDLFRSWAYDCGGRIEVSLP